MSTKVLRSSCKPAVRWLKTSSPPSTSKAWTQGSPRRQAAEGSSGSAARFQSSGAVEEHFIGNRSRTSYGRGTKSPRSSRTFWIFADFNFPLLPSDQCSVDLRWSHVIVLLQTLQRWLRCLLRLSNSLLRSSADGSSRGALLASAKRYHGPWWLGFHVGCYWLRSWMFVMLLQ